MRVGSGVPGFDDLIEGGFPANQLYIVSGPPGSGKSTFSAQFVTRGVESGARCLYISMHETASELARAMSRYSFPFEKALESDQLHYLHVFDEESAKLLSEEQSGDYLSSVQNQVRRIRGFIDDHNLDRVVVDSTMILRHYYSNEQDSFLQFITGLKQSNVTTILISEMTDPTSYSDDQYLAHGVVFLHNFIDHETGDMTRGIQVIKLRGTDIDTNIYSLTFTSEGLSVDPKQAIGR